MSKRLDLEGWFWEKWNRLVPTLRESSSEGGEVKSHIEQLLEVASGSVKFTNNHIK